MYSIFQIKGKIRYFAICIRQWSKLYTSCLCQDSAGFLLSFQQYSCLASLICTCLHIAQRS